MVEWSGPTFDVLLVRTAMSAIAAASVWIIAILAAVLVEACSHGRFRLARALGCPSAGHRWLLGLVSAALTATVLTPGTATAAASGADLDGLPLPDRPWVGRARAEPPGAVSGVMRVRAGQSLWGISADRLPPTASTQQIADLTRSLYAHNRAVIGGDPDLIVPGQILSLPPIPRETDSEDS